jgi:hypothetical protein
MRLRQLAEGLLMRRAVGSRDLRKQVTLGPREAPCPGCGRPVICSEAEFTFDSQGFESYQMDCRSCRVSLDGIVDPFDEALLISVRAAPPR